MCTEWRDAVYCDDILYEYSLVSANDDWPTQYCPRNESDGASIIDLMLANRLFEYCMILDRNQGMGSDRDIIEWEANMEKQEEAGGKHDVG